MKKITFFSSVAVASIILGLSGCGGGGGGSSTVPTTSPATGTGYYVDSAVSGVTYQCGNITGTTDSDGKFTFEVGHNCEFSLANLRLRDVNASSLSNGARIVETNTTVATLLQSLDADGNPANGIEIRREVVDALIIAVNEQNLTTIPTGNDLESIINAVDVAIPGLTLNVKTPTEVETHITQTQTQVIKELLAGKTFYVVGDENNEWRLFEIQFNNAVTTISSNEGVDNITITGNRITFSRDTDGSYSIIIPMSNYILFDDRNADGSKDGSGHYLFSNQADAQAFLNSKTAENNTNNNTLIDNKFTTAYLNGKTFYFVQYDDFGYDDEGEPGLRWNMARMVFSTNSYTWQEYNTPDTAVHTFNYTITDDGEISYRYVGNTGDNSDTGTISLVSVEDNYLKVCEDGDCNTYMFFNQANAQAFVTSHNN